VPPSQRHSRERETGSGDGLPTPFAERVLDLVAAIPAGKVMAYGDIAAALGEQGPRQVGTVMSRWGGGVPWHRVVRASGEPAQCHEGEALRLLRVDGTPLRPDGTRVVMAQARWVPDLGRPGRRTSVI
jgi:alkylated DNA nucleotide flippase Atl1